MSAIGIAVVLFIGLTLIVGIRTYAKIRGRATNYCVAGNAMPVGVVGIALCAQAFDANGSVGNASLVHSSGFWAGAVIPIGLALCLFIAGTWFAEPLHRMRLMTLADFYRRRYSVSIETLAAGLMLLSNIVLVAGNLAGLGLLLQIVFGLPYLAMLVAVAVCILAYAVSGGLHATIATSVLFRSPSSSSVSSSPSSGWVARTVGAPCSARRRRASRALDGLLSREGGALVNWAALASNPRPGSRVVLDLANVITRNLIQRHSRSPWNDERMLRFSRWIALPTMTAAVVFAYLRPQPGVLLILAFDIVLAGCFVPLLLGLFWRRANAPGALAGVIAGTAARMALHVAVADAYRGLDTLLAPVFSLVAMVVVSLLTQEAHRPRHDELKRAPSERDLVAGLDSGQ